MLSNLPKLNKFIDERNEFSLKTFGHPKEHNFKLPLNKLREELEELLKNPDDNLINQRLFIFSYIMISERFATF